MLGDEGESKSCEVELVINDATHWSDLTAIRATPPILYRVRAYWGHTLSAPSNSAAAPIEAYADGDGDGMSNEWERFYGSPLNPSVPDGTLDADGDGLTNFEEFQLGTSPIDYFDGNPIAPLEKVGPPPAVGEVGQPVAQPLSVRVHWVGHSEGLAGAPIEFTVRSSDESKAAWISPSLSPPAWQQTPLLVQASADGIASVYLRLPQFFRFGQATVTAHILSHSSPGTTGDTFFLLAAVGFNPPEMAPRLVNSTLNPSIHLHTDRYCQDDLHSWVEDVKWQYYRPTVPVVPVARTAIPSAICIPDTASDFKWLHQRNGAVNLTMVFGPNSEFTKTSGPLTLGSFTTTTLHCGNYPDGNFAAGSPAAHCADQIDRRIEGKGGYPMYANPYLNLFSTANPQSTPSHPDGEYVWSTPGNSATPCWVSDIDLTCLPVWNSGYFDTNLGRQVLVGPYELGCLVTPRIVLVADHFAATEGSTFRFVTRTNEVVTREVVAYVRVIGDLGFVVLNAALPPEIKPAKVLGSVDHLGVDDPEFRRTDPLYTGNVSPIPYVAPWGVPCFGINQGLRAFVMETKYQFPTVTPGGGQWRNYQPTGSTPGGTTLRSELYEQIRRNDSSKPCFLTKNGEAVLVTLWTTGGGPPYHPTGFGEGAAVQADLSYLETKIAEFRTLHPELNDSVNANWAAVKENFDRDENGNDYPLY